ncbi:MAG: SpoIID/LytB domain-containing protein [Phycisphaerales bacterium]
MTHIIPLLDEADVTWTPQPTPTGRFRAGGSARSMLLGLAVSVGLAGCGTFTTSDGPTGGTASRAPRPPIVTPRPDVGPRVPERSVGEPEVRVRLASRRREAVLGGPSELSLQPVGERTAIRVLSTPVRVELTDSAWEVSDGRGKRSVLARTGSRREDALLVLPVGPLDLTLNGAAYPGELRLVPRRAESGGGDGQAGSVSTPSFDVIEHVALERYLPGVVSKELIANWSLEAFKAQAVAARSYAIQERDRSVSEGGFFDLEASEQDQAYSGTTLNPTALRGVEQTRGLVLKWNGVVLRSYYSSTCGGRPGSAKDTWPTRRGFEYNLAEPIQGKPRLASGGGGGAAACPCEFSPRHRWTVNRARQDVVDRLRAYGRDQGLAVRDISSLSRVTVTQQNEAGRPARYRLFDAAGKWYELSAEQLRLACNTPAAGRANVDAKTRVFSGDLAFTFSGDQVRIDGRGFGHGVGMCQFGAEGMARKGAGFLDVLKFYYPGAGVEKAY